MIRQYGAGQRQGGHNPLGVGMIPAGAIFYLQDEDWWRNRYRGEALCRDPWIVEAFLNGVMHAARRNRHTGAWEDIYLSGRSDMAVMRSLSDGRRRRVAVRTLILHEEHGLTKGPAGYPTMPDLRMYCVTSQHREEISHVQSTAPDARWHGTPVISQVLQARRF